VHPERFELPTKWFEATYSIQLSYGCRNCWCFSIPITITTNDAVPPSGNPERLIRHLAEPNPSPLRGAPSGAQNAMRFVELPTKWFEATYSIQLSYGCVEAGII